MYDEKGITIVEIIVTIFLIGVFSMILISDFPRIQRQMSLSRAAYRLAQDLRRAQDLSLSGVELRNDAGEKVSQAGYGIYINISTPLTDTYSIYADTCLPFDFKYTAPYNLCSGGDQIIESVDLGVDYRDIYIRSFSNISQNYTSIDFIPPNPTTTIDNIAVLSLPIKIVLGVINDASVSREVVVNSSGLIEVK